jgi:hypothetical protein
MKSPNSLEKLFPIQDRARGRTIARLIQILELYSGVRVAYECTYGFDSAAGFGTVSFFGPWATYTWEGDTDTPAFKFLQDEGGHLAWYQYMFQPMIDDADFHCLKYSNAQYTIQEIAALDNPSSEQAYDLMFKHMHGWDEAKCMKYLHHFLDCASKYRRHIQGRIKDIAEQGCSHREVIDLS